MKKGQLILDNFDSPGSSGSVQGVSYRSGQSFLALRIRRKDIFDKRIIFL